MFIYDKLLRLFLLLLLSVDFFFLIPLQKKKMQILDGLEMQKNRL
jgi:hypothetical protein